MKKEVFYIQRLDIDKLITTLRRMKKTCEQGFVGKELYCQLLKTKDGREIVLAYKKAGDYDKIETQAGRNDSEEDKKVS